jgi:hypothetical protein
MTGQGPPSSDANAARSVPTAPAGAQPGSVPAVREMEDARVGYQTAVSLWVYEGTLICSKYNALLVANSIVLAVTGFTANTERPPISLRVGLPVVGVVLCAFWLLLTKRGFDNYVYWVLSAREIEDKYLPDVQTVSRGGRFADGSPVVMSLRTGSVGLRMSKTSRLFKASTSSYVIVACFIALYVLLALRF